MLNQNQTDLGIGQTKKIESEFLGLGIRGISGVYCQQSRLFVLVAGQNALLALTVLRQKRSVFHRLIGRQPFAFCLRQFGCVVLVDVARLYHSRGRRHRRVTIADSHNDTGGLLG